MLVVILTKTQVDSKSFNSSSFRQVFTSKFGSDGLRSSLGKAMKIGQKFPRKEGNSIFFQRFHVFLRCYCWWIVQKPQVGSVDRLVIIFYPHDFKGFLGHIQTVVVWNLSTINSRYVFFPTVAPPLKTKMTGWKIHPNWRYIISYWKFGFPNVILVFREGCPAAEQLDDRPPWKLNSEFTPELSQHEGEKQRNGLSTS